MDKLPTQVATSVLARIKNPLVGSFVITWTIFNWKIPVLLLALSEPAAQRTSAIEAALSQHGSFLYPAIVSVAYLAISPWIWLVLRVYLDIPEDRAKRRDRARQEADHVYESECLEREVKLIQARQQKLHGSKEFDRIKAQSIAFFETLSNDVSLQSEEFREKIKKDIDTLEAKVLPRITKALEEQSVSVAAIEQKAQLAERIRKDVEALESDVLPRISKALKEQSAFASAVERKAQSSIAILQQNAGSSDEWQVGAMKTRDDWK